MGSNRVMPVSTTMPTQTHTPSGSRSPPVPMLDMSSLIKSEPTVHMEAAMTRCNSETWAESYQDLSSWCRATSASSPALCQSPVTDEILVNDFESHGEIDFDLRKSEEIASIPLEEDCSFNLWDVGSPLSTDISSPRPLVLADTSTVKSNPVLLKDCWWPEIEQAKVVRELESSRSQALSTSSSVSTKNHLNCDNSSATVVIKEEVSEAKENMNPIVVSQAQLLDPAKMAELQMRIGRIASMAQPGATTRPQNAELLKILQAALNKKRYRSPAAVSDLHNYSKLPVATSTPSTSGAGPVPTMAGNTSDIFQSDPFEGLGLFSEPDSMAQRTQPAVATSHQPAGSVAIAPSFVLDDGHTTTTNPAMQGSTGGNVLHGSDLFSEAHHEIMRQAVKPQELTSQPQQSQQQFSAQQHAFQATNQTANISSAGTTQRTPAVKNGLHIQLPPPRLPEMDINFDALLFGSPGVLAGGSRAPAMSTPEVLKPLVETPDPESFDLLSYLFDDKMSTPPVSLESNPFHFSQASTSDGESTSTTVTEHKPNVMVVKPLTHKWAHGKSTGMGVQAGNDSPVIVEVKPQILPNTLPSMEEDKNFNIKVEESQVVTENNVAEPVKEAQVSPRPSRTARKRKYSEDEFVLSPSTIEEVPKPSRSRRRGSSKYDSDEEFTLPTRKSRKRTVSVIEEEDEEEEDLVKPKRSRAAATARRSESTVSSSSDADRYRELRDRNNEASRKSRLTRKAREQELSKQAEVLTKENRVLKVKVEEMEKLVKKLREALLQSMMNKKS